MNITLTHCNNIDSGTLAIVENRLNIKYAMNGTGKSTIARAIELYKRGDGSLKELTPFKILETGRTDKSPSISGLDGITSVAIFNDDYISKFAFQQDEVLANSFNIFVRTPDYDKHITEIETIIAEIKGTFRESADIDQVIGDLSTLSESFGKSKSGYSESGALAKGIGKGNKVVNIPKGLESYEAYLRSSQNSKWLKWQIDGNTFSGLSDNCPFCTSPTLDKKEVISQVGKEYDAKAIEHLNKIVAVLTSLGRYFTNSANEKLTAITRNITGISKEEKSYLLQIKEQVDTLKSKMLDLRGMTYFSMKDATKVSEWLRDLKINLKYLSELDSDSTRLLVDKINASLDAVLSKVGVLQGEIAQQNRLVKDTIEGNKTAINDFLKSAGYKYQVDVEYVNATYRMRLRHVDLSQVVEHGGQHLSYGEKNAFALILFMFECLSKSTDMIILDDPISSFERNKKYAVIDMLFRGKKSLRNKTTLMMTHDLEPIIDILYNLPHHFDPLPTANFLEMKAGVIREVPITREDLSTFGQICDANINRSVEDVVKLVYLRRYYQILNDKGLAYQLLSNLLHKRPEPFKKHEDKQIPLSKTEIATATTEIRSKIPSFDYNELLKKVSDDKYMKAVYMAASCNYDKLHLFRILTDGDNTSNVIRKFVNEAFHIENEYIMQINPCKYEIVPSFIIDECNKVLPAD